MDLGLLLLDLGKSANGPGPPLLPGKPFAGLYRLAQLGPGLGEPGKPFAGLHRWAQLGPGLGEPGLGLLCPSRPREPPANPSPPRPTAPLPPEPPRLCSLDRPVPSPPRFEIPTGLCPPVRPSSPAGSSSPADLCSPPPFELPPGLCPPPVRAPPCRFDLPRWHVPFRWSEPLPRFELPPPVLSASPRPPLSAGSPPFPPPPAFPLAGTICESNVGLRWPSRRSGSPDRCSLCPGLNSLSSPASPKPPGSPPPMARPPSRGPETTCCLPPCYLLRAGLGLHYPASLLPLLPPFTLLTLPS
ncbi:vegetative cell wall protein gp1-like [Ananas comosus]|uniref:Vegetative cell wall protein gp1-like n=1 Tax=Ananas comosus TaxID=4615 RepID=A0A6P5GX82_ANACO|nr:vegetative cell wall protein gp1-like [Ananas comosus]